MKNKSHMIERQLEHRTIRKFIDQKLSQETIDLLLGAVQRTATSAGLQASSIIRITDKKLRKEISEVCQQDYVFDAPELWVFVLDQCRNKRISEEKGHYGTSIEGMDYFFSGFIDASISAQNLVNAAESIGLGTFFLGSVSNDIDKVCELLKLPKFTFPVIGIGLGIPNENPQIKPRMPMKHRVFENEYVVYDNYLDELKNYDHEMTSYYDLRSTNKKSSNFTDQVVEVLKGSFPQRQTVLRSAKKQGFDLWLDKEED